MGVGETRINNQGLSMTIVSVHDDKLIDVEFEDGFISYNKHYCNFKKGEINSYYKGTVCGIGYIGYENTRINGELIDSYDKWASMLKRCYSSKYKCRQPSYEGCVVCEEWHSYSNFKIWYDENYYRINDEVMCLDKDILVKGNKIYSPENCIFVPQNINCLFVNRRIKRGKYPVGVSIDSRNGKYLASLSISSIENKKCKTIGVYNSPEEAFYSYKEAKEKYIKQMADEFIKIKYL